MITAPLLGHCLRFIMLTFGLLQDIEDLADASGTEFGIPAGFDDQVSVLTDLK